MTYQKLENSNALTEKDNLTIKKTNLDYQFSNESIDDDSIIQNEKKLKEKYKKKAEEYYKMHGNLNEFIYSTDNQELRNKFEKWMISFYNKTLNDKKTTANSKLSYEDVNPCHILF